MVIGGIGYVHTDNLDRADQAAAVAVAAEQSRRDRVDDAAADRLNGLATAIASERRQEALVAARTAVETADAVVVVAAQLLAAETVSPLGAAAAQLAEMVQQNPDPLMLSVDLNPLATTGSTVTSTDPATAPATAEPAAAPATAEPAAAPKKKPVPLPTSGWRRGRSARWRSVRPLRPSRRSTSRPAHGCSSSPSR